MQPHRLALATTLPAPPDEVSPWLVQMGADRAGFSSLDRHDTGGRPSAEVIHPGRQDLEEGARNVAVPDGGTPFTVARMEAPRTLVLSASMTLTGHPFDPAVAPTPAPAAA